MQGEMQGKILDGDDDINRNAREHTRTQPDSRLKTQHSMRSSASLKQHNAAAVQQEEVMSQSLVFLMTDYCSPLHCADCALGFSFSLFSFRRQDFFIL